VAGLTPRAEVRAALTALTAEAELVHGHPDRCEPVDADPERGAFLPPMLLRSTDPDARAPHEVEVFGPVSTLLPYDSTAHAVALAARGAGSLAGSVVSHDPAFVREVVHGLAPWHGRLLVLDRDDAAESTGHGSPIPHAVHGGPGRAGGGEELGGLRAVLHHMQRTALQGSPAMLRSITE
jgi:oxepin-CoA hydrolase/3-oxo-5,6-dehydrosuberyl-CoA semialdehyde dehydrogenase